MLRDHRGRLGLLAAGLFGVGLFAAGCTSTVIIVECDDGEVRCDGVCVDPQADPDHCGGCDRPCPEGECTEGTCLVDPCADGGCEECPGSLLSCDGECVDTITDARHCGACDAACSEEETCIRATCLPDCTCNQCDVVTLTNGETTFAGTLIGADDSYSPTCVLGSGGDVAHRFVAPESGSWTFDTAGSPTDTVLALLSGCQEVACNDDDLGTTSRVTVELGAGQEVLAVVDAYAPGIESSYTLTVQRGGTSCGGLTSCDGACVDTFSDPSHCGGCFIPCGLDEGCVGGVCEAGCDEPVCNLCGPIVDLFGDLPILVVDSTVDRPDDVQPGCVDANGPEVVYRFRVPFSGFYGIDTAGSSFDTVLSVRDVASCSEIACNDDTVGTDARLDLDLFEGQDLLIVVDGFGASGDFRLQISAGFEGAPSRNGR